MAGRESRRQFLSTGTGAASLLATAATWNNVQGAAADTSGRLRLGLIGCGGIMGHHIQGLVKNQSEGVQIAWLCDIDPAQLVRSAKAIPQVPPPRQTSRFEEVLADDTVHACVIATPHHWHAPIALAAMAAGKDVYIEKPISHVFREGDLIIAAARKYGRVVQQGSQMRSSPVTAQAERLLNDGVIGEVKVARAWTAELRDEVRPLPDGTPPEGADYDRWLGPAPSRPFNPHRWHATWRMFRDYGNGEIGDDGIHDLDMAAWGLGVQTLPKFITARGGRMMLPGHASEYPDNMNVTYEYTDGRLLIYENYPFTGYGLYGFDNGNVFYGTKGYMVFSRRGAFSVFLGNKGTPGPTELKETRGLKGYDEHMTNFLQAIRDRSVPRANAETAHRSCALVHLGEAAYRTRGRLEFDAAAGRFVDATEADALLDKPYRAPYGLPVV